jgi:hypothetical protein
MYETTWYTYQTVSPFAKDNAVGTTLTSYAGWHDLVMHVANGTVTYLIDGVQVYQTTGKYYPRTLMRMKFSQWITAFLAGGVPRSWAIDVDWVYHSAGEVVSRDQVLARVADYRAGGITRTDTIPAD